MPGEVKHKRVQKILSEAGICSRRAGEKLIADGRVTVDGETVILGDKADPSTQSVEVDGVRVEPAAVDRCYIALHKPRGVLSTTHDPGGRLTVLDLLPGRLREERRLYPVGRLDMESTGLVLLTDDGFLANRVLHPSFEVPRKYVVEVEPAVSDGGLNRIREGMILPEGPAGPASVRVLGEKGGSMTVEVKIHTGRKRQIRRSFERVGSAVKSLLRVSIGSLELGSLEPGQCRVLEPDEVCDLYRSTGI